jgi:hypothetical protein
LSAVYRPKNVTTKLKTAAKQKGHGASRRAIAAFGLVLRLRKSHQGTMAEEECLLSLEGAKKVAKKVLWSRYRKQGR